MAATEHSTPRTEPVGWDAAAKAMFRAAQAVAQAGGPKLFADLVRELADTLRVATVFVAVFGDETRRQMRTLAAVMDGRTLQNFDYTLEGTPCAKVVGRAFRHVPRGVAAEFAPGTIFAAKGMDSYAAFPLSDSDGNPLGLLVAMDRQPIADAALAEALLKIFAGRMVAEIERSHVDEALRAAALAVSSTRGDSVFVELVRLLAAILRVDVAFISRYESDEPQTLHILAMQAGQQMQQDVSYPIRGTPCETVLGQHFRVYPDRLCEQFPEDTDAQAEGIVSYAGFPLVSQDGTPLGTVAIASRSPLLHVERIESVLQIFAVRAAAEIEQLRATEALRKSEASYRAIFEAAEVAIFIHDWDSGAILDVNPKACANYGYTRDEIRRLSVAQLSADVTPITAEEVMQKIQLARLDRCTPFEWQRRHKDGSLHWDEVRLKPATIDGRRHILAFTREITEHKAALEALRAREEQYRVIFDGSADSLALWNSALRKVDTNPAYTRLFGYTRDEAIGMSFPDNLDTQGQAARIERIRAALAGQEGSLETYGVRRDGSRFDLELRYLPIRYAGEPHVLAVGRDITERKRAEAALRDSESQYRAIFNASADALVLRDADFRIVDVNATYERMSGMPHTEVLGQDRVIANPAEVAPTIRALHQRALAGETIELEVPFLSRDGARYQIELRGVPIRHRGQPHVLYIGRDITERKRAEAALRASEEQYRAIFNASADALLLRDAEHRAVEVNPAYLGMSGYGRDEVLGATGSLTQTDALLQRQYRQQHDRALAGETLRFEVQASRKDGTRFHAEVRGVPVSYRGQPHVLYAARDITERHTAEARLRASEEQYRAIFNASADALILWNSRFVRVDVNPAYERVFGWSRDDVVGRGVDGPNPDDDSAHPRRELVQRALAGEACSAERPARRKDGTRILVEVSAIPFQHQGEPHVLAIVRDVTERRAAEAERERLEAQLRQAQKMEAIGQLTGGIAHDFNNILTSVIGYLVLGQERAGTLGDQRLQRQLDKAHLAAQRARELIAQMLAFARRQRGERRVLPLAPLVRQTLQLLRSTLPTSVAVNAVLPPDDASPCVAADAVQLEQVLFNLCINARDAIGESGMIKVRLRESAGAFTCASCRAQLPAAHWIELSVTDNGSGIEADTLERMFEPFYSTKEVGRGSGMGLAMVHGIVHDHGGHVIVETVPLAGSVFRVLLPPAQAEAPSEPEVVIEAVAERPLVGRVMVVDDEAMVGDFMAELLDGWGLEVVLQRDPLQALAWLEKPGEALDLLITDQTMPQLSGLQLAQRAGSLRPGLPVLLYTGNAEGIDAEEAQRHGVCGVLRKPVDAEALQALMQRCLKRADGGSDTPQIRQRYNAAPR